MLLRSLPRLFGQTSLRSLAPYDPYGGRGDGRDDGRRATTLGRAGRDDGRSYRQSDRGNDPLRPRPRPGGRALALVGLGLAALLVIVGTVAAEVKLSDQSGTTGSGSTGATASGTAAVGTPGNPTATTSNRPPPAPGWSQAGPAWAQRGAIAQSAPSRMYLCGFATPNAQTGAISLGVSTNGGAAWQTLATPARGAYCDVRVSTTTPQDVALLAMAVCDPESCTSSDPNQLYVSTDGGDHWTQTALPTNNGATTLPTTTFAWAGNTLFVETTNQSQAGTHYLAAGTNGQGFAWVDQNINGPPPGASAIAGEMRAIGTTVYITFSGGCNTPDTGCLMIVRSNDGGATWSHATPTYTGTAYSGVGAIRLVAGAPGAPLVGAAGMCQCSAAPLVRSTDGGATWTDLPGFPPNYQAREFWTTETPDGTVYATLADDSGGTIGIYALAPGAKSWRLVAYPTGGQSWALAAATWDAGGHPMQVWGWSWSNDEVDGVWRHAP